MYNESTSGTVYLANPSHWHADADGVEAARGGLWADEKAGSGAGQEGGGW